LVFNLLFHSQGRNKLNESLIELLIENFNSVRILNDEMQDIEIIDDDFELDLFTIINGNSNKTELLSPKQLQLEVSRVLKYLAGSGAKKAEEVSKP
jgi:inositol 1,4,5-triphosphate receptor type 1